MREVFERIEILKQAGFVDKNDAESLKNVVALIEHECGPAESDEHIGIIITHIAAALKRNVEEEEIAPINQQALEEVYASPVFPKANRIANDISDMFAERLSKDEFDFVLVHIAGLLVAHQ